MLLLLLGGCREESHLCLGHAVGQGLRRCAKVKGAAMSRGVGSSAVALVLVCWYLGRKVVHPWHTKLDGSDNASFHILRFGSRTSDKKCKSSLHDRI